MILGQQKQEKRKLVSKSRKIRHQNPVEEEVMINWKNINISEQPISQIFDLVPEIRTVRDTFARNRLYKFCESKLNKIEHKLSHSPYMPYTTAEDRLNVNRDFPTAVCKWLSQFPENERFGFLLMVLSIIYITEKEMDTFLEIAIENSCQVIKEREGRSLEILEGIEDVKHKIIPYSLSDTGIYDKFIHKMAIEGTSDRDRRPFRGPLGDYLYDIFVYLRQLAETGKDTIYWEMWFNNIEALISSFLNYYIILVEDYTFSGRTIRSDIKRLLILSRIIFEPFRQAIEAQGYRLPYFFLLVPTATDIALKEINSLFSGNLMARRYFHPPITGYLFDYSYRAINDIPQSLRELKGVFPKKIKLYAHLKRSLEFFHKEYSVNYWTRDTEIAARSPFKINDYVFGYAKGAWPIITSRNSPNNSLPPIWYPHKGSSINILPLFQRVESRISHIQRPVEIEEHIRIALSDKQGYLKQILKEYYERNL